MTEAQAVILAAFVAAAAAIWVGWLQHRALREQNRIGAFERRLAVFKDAQIALSSVFHHGDADVGAISSMTKAVQASWFLFPRTISDRLTKMRDQMVDLSTAAEIVRHASPGPDHALNVKLKHETLKALNVDLTSLADLFRPYISLEPNERNQHPLAWIDDVLDGLERRRR
jgi:hypothetical protein